MIEVRCLEASDVLPLARLWEQSWLSTGLSAPNDPSLKEYEERLLNEGFSVWTTYVAISTGQLVGFVAWEQKYRWLRQLFIHPELKRQGFGSRLLDLAKRELPAGFWLRTNADNAAAQAFFASQGLTTGNEMAHPVLGHQLIDYSWP